MPYCSGIGNLIFAVLLGQRGGSGEQVLTNSLVNNLTNMTLLIGLPTVLWGMNVLPAGRGSRKPRGKDQQQKLNRLSLLLTITAVLFFTGAVWALARDGRLDLGDGLVLTGLFLFWQCFHVFDVLKSNVKQNRSYGWMLAMNLGLLAIGAWAVYASIEWLVEWTSKIQAGFVSAKNMGLLSGWLMVVPNGLLAFYYARKGNPEVVYTSQIGDGHICIPLCVGLGALYSPIKVGASFENGLFLLLGTALVHFVFVAVLGRLPRWAGAGLCAAYVIFLYAGLPRG
jgi:cation:H+ antiporter